MSWIRSLGGLFIHQLLNNPPFCMWLFRVFQGYYNFYANLIQDKDVLVDYFVSVQSIFFNNLNAETGQRELWKSIKVRPSIITIRFKASIPLRTVTWYRRKHEIVIRQTYDIRAKVSDTLYFETWLITLLVWKQYGICESLSGSGPLTKKKKWERFLQWFSRGNGSECLLWIWNNMINPSLVVMLLSIRHQPDVSFHH